MARFSRKIKDRTEYSHVHVGPPPSIHPSIDHLPPLLTWEVGIRLRHNDEDYGIFCGQVSNQQNASPAPLASKISPK